MHRAARLSLLAVVLFAPALFAEVTRETPLVEETGYTLREGEWKLGIGISSYGITDRLQINSALLLDLLLLNAGLKFKLIDEANLALSVGAYGGSAALLLLFKVNLLFGGVRLDASLPVADRVAIHLSGKWEVLYLGSLAAAPPTGITLATGRMSWFHLKAAAQYVWLPRHIFFFSIASPTSWVLAIGRTSHDFDAFNFAEAKVGYQLSKGSMNLRLDVGVGPSVLTGFGPVASVDGYFRF